jgi:hypothetical protein
MPNAEFYQKMTWVVAHSMPAASRSGLMKKYSMSGTNSFTKA